MDKPQKSPEIQEERYRTILETASSGYWFLDTAGHLLDVNETYCRMSGYSAQELLAMGIPDLEVAETAEDTAAHIRKIMAEGEGRFESRHRRKDGTVFDVEVSVQYRSTEGGWFVAFLRDITARKSAEQALKESEEKYRELVENLNDVIFTTSVTGILTYISPMAERLSGYAPAECIGQPFSRFIHPDDLPLVQKRLGEVLLGKLEPTEYRMLTRSGAVCWVRSSSRPSVTAGQVTGIQGLLTDITKRKQAEEDLRESKALIDAVVENVPLMIFLKEATDLRFVIFNRAGEELLGYDRKALLGKNNLDLFPPEQAAHFMAKDREVLDGETGILDIPEEPILTAKKGQRLLHTRKVCILGADGTTKFLLGISEDITERKRAEAEKVHLEALFQQAQKMQLMGRLAGGVAHDFNNMLQAILGNADLALAEIPPDSPVRDCLEEIRNCARRSADLTRQLVAFARRQTIAPRVLDLNEVVEGLLKMLRRLIGEEISLAWLPAAGLGPVKADPSQVDQILANLCVNARDAIGLPMSQGDAPWPAGGVGKITIATENAAFDEAYCAGHLGFVPGEYVVLAVSDNGRGMDQETQAHLFEPFFTTKGGGDGTGLGLATIYGIVTQNNGFIHVDSATNKGTTFKIYLPRHKNQAAGAWTENAAREPAKGSGETVLLVEDEPAILTIAQRVLARLGYTVLTANTPGEALRLAGAHTREIHLLVTDVVMPEMNGFDLARQLLSHYPKLKCLFMSGYMIDVIAHHDMLDKEMQFIQKPFSLEGLAAKVRETLASQPAGPG